MGGLTGKLIEPLLANYLSGVPDNMIPQLAHSLVDNAIQNGELSLFEGKVVFELDDLQELKELLRYNLPIQAEKEYNVITEPIPQGNDVENK